MTLGQKINQLRTQKNLSQGDLADRLGVSRQSISKWETDGSVPDLDNLIKLSQIFSITLEELILNKTSDPTPAATAPPYGSALSHEQKFDESRNGFPVRLISGWALLICSFIGILIFAVLGDAAAGMMLTTPFMVGALICFTVRKYTGLVFFWVFSILMDGFFRFGTGINWHLTNHLFDSHYMAGGFTVQMLIAIIELIWLWSLILFTVRRFRQGTVSEPKKLGLGWILYLFLNYLINKGLVFIVTKLSMTSLFGDAGILYMLLYLFIDWILVGIFTFLSIHTLRFFREHRKSKQIIQ